MPSGPFWSHWSRRPNWVGANRNIPVDTEGLLLRAVVHAADI
jgi:hypothetical protein